MNPQREVSSLINLFLHQNKEQHLICPICLMYIGGRYIYSLLLQEVSMV